MNKLLKNKWLLYFLIIPFFEPNCISYISNIQFLDSIFKLWKVTSIILIVTMYICRNKYSKIMFIIIIFQGSFVLSSAFNGVSLIKPISNFLTVLGFSMLIELCLKVDLSAFLKVTMRTLSILLMINFAFAVIYPKGIPFANLYTSNLNPMFFWSIDNGMIKYLLPTVSFTLLYYGMVYRRSSKSTITIIISVALSTSFIVGSATGIAIMFIFVVLSLIYVFSKARKIPLRTILISYSSLFIALIILQSNLSIIGKITSLFNRSGTFTGRYLLWEKAIELILDKPIIGYGYTSGNISVWGGTYSSHNLYLEWAIHGGYISLFLGILMILYTVKKLLKTNGNYFSNIIFITIFCFMLEAMFETGFSFALAGFLVLGYHSKYFSPNSKFSFSLNNTSYMMCCNK